MAVNTKKNFVVDASFVLTFLLPDEHDPNADIYFNQFKAGLINFISSPLLTFEVINTLIISLKRKRIDKNYCQERIKELLDYDIEIKEADSIKTFLLAEKDDLTFYDASYLYLAQSQNFPLLTLDKKLQKLSQI